MKNNFPVLIYRVSHFLYYHRFKMVSRMIDWVNRLVFSCFVPGQAQIGGNLQLAYWGLGVVVHTRSRIGKNCHIGQNVTIGGNRGGVPKVLDNVRIGGG